MCYFSVAFMLSMFYVLCVSTEKQNVDHRRNVNSVCLQVCPGSFLHFYLPLTAFSVVFCACFRLLFHQDLVKLAIPVFLSRLDSLQFCLKKKTKKPQKKSIKLLQLLHNTAVGVPANRKVDHLSPFLRALL